jgi:hypothetical protein
VSLEPEVAPLPAAPGLPEELGLDEEEDAPPLDGLFWSELVEELDEGELDGEEPMVAEPELELDGLDGVLVAPLEDEEPEGELDGLVVLDEPVAARSFPARSQAVSIVAPSAMETAIARVDSLMWPPWFWGTWGFEQGLGRAARHLSIYLLRVMGAVSALFGPAESPLCWKSRCCSAWFGSTGCESGAPELRLSSPFPAPWLTDDCTGLESAPLVLPVAAEGVGAAGVAELVFGAGVGAGRLRSQAVSAPASTVASERAAARVNTFMAFSSRGRLADGLQSACPRLGAPRYHRGP